MEKQQNDKLNVWVLVVLSFLPFASVYTILKLKKFWKMTAINFGIVCIMVLMMLVFGPGTNLSESTPFDFLPSLTVFIAYVSLWTAQPICVYHWTTQWNQKLQPKIES